MSRRASAFAGLLILVPALSTQQAAREPAAAWSAQVGANLQREEYHFSPVEPGVFSAPNRCQDLRSRVSASGLEVFPRTASADATGVPWRVCLRTTGFGRAGDVRELPRPHVSIRESRAQLDHGFLLEWYENREEGLEQGWTIPARPVGAEPVWIGLEIAGDLALRLDGGARSGVLVDALGETRLCYRDLHVFDATGRELEALFQPSPQGIGVEIDEAGAVYPLTVDPILTGPAWTAESDQEGARFGISVSSAGDVNGDGYSDVIVGADLYDNGEMNEGRAHVYLGSVSGLSASAAWTAESDQATAVFGRSVATAGDVNGDGYSDVVVGAAGYSNGQGVEGRAFVYLGSASGLASSAAWTAESDQGSALFGVSAACAGDVDGDGYSDVIVGADSYDNVESDEGRAFVYLGSASGLASSAAWTAESDQDLAAFGNSVSSAGDVNGDGYSDVIVGAPQYSSEGRASVYLGSASGLSAAWTAQSGQSESEQYMSVSAAGDVNGDGYGDVIVGFPLHDNGQLDEGRASVYLGSASGLPAGAAWMTESDQATANHGNSVASGGDVNGDGYSDVVVGAYAYDNGENAEGRASVYLGSASGLATGAAWTAESDQDSALLGNAVSGAGDVNGDGYSDVIVGADMYDNGQSDEGRAFVFLGQASGLATSAAWTAESNQLEAAIFGAMSVSGAGDVNGDGYSDAIVAWGKYDNGQAEEGRAQVYLGSSTGLSTSAAWSAESDQAGAEFGLPVSSAGDVNGDGYGDVVVGARLYDNGQTDEGRAYVYLGSGTGLAAGAAWTAEGDQASAFFGRSVASAGDVDGDGYLDVIVGALGYDDDQTDEGRAYVYLGSGTGLSTSAAWTSEVPHRSATGPDG